MKLALNSLISCSFSPYNCRKFEFRRKESRAKSLSSDSLKKLYFDRRIGSYMGVYSELYMLGL